MVLVGGGGTGHHHVWTTVSSITTTFIIIMMAIVLSTVATSYGSTAKATDLRSSEDRGVTTTTNETSFLGQGQGDDLSCEVARMKCAFRVGCGMALQNYMVGCSDVMSGRIRHCNDLCKKALIALTSTDEGQQLMRCDCRGQDFCQVTKQRIEICRADVMAANEQDAVVSCSVAQWICAADPLCSTAVEYYRRLCRSMFHGKKCTLRCNNSIAILNRQEKAAKLKTCVCDGTEDYDCDAIKFNMDRLCFPKSTLLSSAPNQHHHHHHHHHGDTNNNSNEIQGDSPGGGSAKRSRHNSSPCLTSSSQTLQTGNLATVQFNLLLLIILLTLGVQMSTVLLGPFKMNSIIPFGT